ncbi:MULTISPECIES: hypothetical protein [unclassified Streptomyces]|uniref:hypothetical protein n=1 Tax=unclassified Streptomyces TaxID=2593676 RepID=UPI00114C8EA0|nr:MULTISPECIES: hypothetical protein [unclassified Streptomyces]MYS22358.1 hypothetical protein [Streptomyces sp. SID4948]
MWTVALAASLLAGAVGQALFGPDGNPPRSVGGTNGQREYIEEIDQARHLLFQGQLVYTEVGSLALVAGGEPRSFRVEILGGWHPVGPDEAQAPVMAGAQIGVKLHCSGAGIACVPLSSERQNVLVKTDRATWMWDVSARNPGEARLAFTATAYLRDSNTVLVEKPPVTVRVDVAAPEDNGRGFSWTRAWRWVAGAITGLGGLAVSVSAIAALVVTVVRRRPPAADPDDPGTEAAQDGGRRPAVRPVRVVRSRRGGARTRPTAVADPRPSRQRGTRDPGE